MAEATDGKETDDIVEREDKILELAIHYVQNGSYPPSLSRDKKRAVRKRAAAVDVTRERCLYKENCTE